MKSKKFRKNTRKQLRSKKQMKRSRKQKRTRKQQKGGLSKITGLIDELNNAKDKILEGAKELSGAKKEILETLKEIKDGFAVIPSELLKVRNEIKGLKLISGTPSLQQQQSNSTEHSTESG